MKMTILASVALVFASNMYGADFNIKDFGAKADGVTLNTEAIQKTIDAAAKAGGGRVLIEGGVYKSGTIYLKSHVEMHLAKDGTLLGSERLEDYNELDAFPQNHHMIPSEGWQGKHLILCLEQEDVAITGEGKIDGNGRAYFETTPYYTGPIAWRFGGCNAKDRKNCIRPGQLIEICESKNIRIRDIRIVDSTAWSCFLFGCENVQVRGLYVENNILNMNTDGIDIDCCKNVTVSDCIFNTGDDAIAIRSDSKKLKDKSRVCEKIVIMNCVAAVSATGCRVGVGVGTIRDVRISNFIVEKAGVGVHVQSQYLAKGGSDISNITFSNCTILNSPVPIWIIGSAGLRPRNIHFRDVYIEEDGSELDKLVRIKNADGVRFTDCTIGTKDTVARELKL